MAAVKAMRGDQTPFAGRPGGVAALGLGHAGDSQSGGLGLGGGGFQRLGGALGRVEQVEVGVRALRQPVLRGQRGIGVFGRQFGHGHGALDQTGAGGVGQVGGGDRGLTPADEDAQAQIAGLLALDLFQFGVAHADGQGGAVGGNRLGGVGAGLQRGGDQIGQDVGGGRLIGHAPIWRTRPRIATRRLRSPTRRSG
ncbi:hypothetical protein D3C72_1112340 [compost metagenome]